MKGKRSGRRIEQGKLSGGGGPTIVTVKGEEPRMNRESLRVIQI